MNKIECISGHAGFLGTGSQDGSRTGHVSIQVASHVAVIKKLLPDVERIVHRATEGRYTHIDRLVFQA